MDIYGSSTLKQINDDLSTIAKKRGFGLKSFQSNEEGKLVTAIQESRIDCSGIVINPAAYTHTSLAILDALLAVDLPKVEVHISNIFGREKMRHKTITAAGVDVVIAGLGTSGYGVALSALIDLIERRR